MTRSWWGWGLIEQMVPDSECVSLSSLLPGLAERPRPVPELTALELPPPRVSPPESLADCCSTGPLDRARHTYGKAYRDVIRALSGDFAAAPDVVAYPRTEAEVIDLLDWAAAQHVAVIPHGGGSSVVGGVEYRGGDHAGVLSLDTAALGQVLEVDRVSRAARVQAGMYGPALEDALEPHGLTLRHFPQSFEFSTVGGWLATRSGGHYATLYTHIDDMVESMRVVTPIGVSESWRLPGSGAGPSPDRLFLGSEGTLGVITEAWLRLQDHPVHRASTAVLFSDFAAGVDAVRAIVQSGANPANCRLLDPGEVRLAGLAAGGLSMLVLGTESAAAPVDAELARLVEIALAHGGTVRDRQDEADDPVAAWREAFLRVPYLRDALARMGAIVETFETACTWDTTLEVCQTVREEVGEAVAKVTGAPGMVNCRFTHVYPDGAAPYFTVLGVGRPGSEVAMWDDIKAAAGEVLHRLGATITHHHAVGRDHRPWYDRQRPAPFGTALAAAKQALDPSGILNPGVLLG